MTTYSFIGFIAPAVRALLMAIGAWFYQRTMQSYSAAYAAKYGLDGYKE
jgi:hypothetical protein